MAFANACTFESDFILFSFSLKRTKNSFVFFSLSNANVMSNIHSVFPKVSNKPDILCS